MGHDYHSKPHVSEINAKITSAHFPGLREEISELKSLIVRSNLDVVSKN